MYSAKAIHDALKEGSRKGFELFPELGTVHPGRQPAARRLADEILAGAGRMRKRLPEPLTYEIFTEYARTGERDRYDRLLTQRLHEAAMLAMAALLEEEPGFLRALEERLWELCGLYTWELSAVVSLDVSDYGGRRPDPRETVGLLAAETAFQLMETVHALGPRLDRFLVYRLHKEVRERVLEPYMRYPFWWQSADTNWQSVCSSSIGCAAIYAVEDEAELAMVLGRIVQGLQSYLEGFGPDGITTEGLEYWLYGFSSFVYFAELLRDRTAGELSLLECQPIIRQIAGFPGIVMLSGGSVANFSDCGERCRLPAFLAARLHRRLGLAYAVAEEDAFAAPVIGDRWPFLSRSLCWPSEMETAAADEGTVFLPHSQWLIDKRYGADGKLFAFAAKGGHNDEMHNHNDLGHFILHIGGKNAMPDLGAPAYNRATFSASRYDSLLTSSRGHAVPVIDGKLQSPGRERAAEVVHRADDGRAVRFGLQLAGAYEVPGLQSFTREWEWRYGEGLLRLRDMFSFRSDGHAIDQTFLFRDEPQLSGPGCLRVDTGSALLEVAYPEEAAVEVFHERYRVRSGADEAVYRVVMATRCVRDSCSFDLQVRIIPHG